MVEAVQGGPGRRRADRSVDSTKQLLALPGRHDLTARVAGRQPSPQPRPSPPVVHDHPGVAKRATSALAYPTLGIQRD